MPGSSELFKVFHLHRAAQQLGAIFARTPSGPERDRLTKTCRDTVHHLQTDPLNWGDPLYRTKKPGGMVYVRAFERLVVRYVAYEIERVVCLSEVTEMSHEAT